MVCKTLVVQTVVLLLSLQGVVGARTGRHGGRRRKEQEGQTNNNNNNKGSESDKDEPVSMREYVHHQKKQSGESIIYHVLINPLRAA